MNAISDSILESFVAACRETGRRGLLRCSSGNLSRRVDARHMLVTASGSWLERLTVDDVSLCLIADGSLLEGRRPTVEMAFHAGILRVRPDVNVVLHVQTPCATTLACCGAAQINFNVIPEIPFYMGDIARVPYLPPGSEDLAAAVIEAMSGHDMAVLANHGQVTVAPDYDHAIQNAEFFELACEIILRARGAAQPLPPDSVATLLERGRAASRGARV